MKRKKKIYLIFCFCLLLAAQPGETFVYAAAQPEENTETKNEPGSLYALSACLMDADSGRILFEKEGDVRRANASTTKILTLIVTLENSDLDETVTVSEYAARQPDVQLNINTGEEYKLRDLCYSMMLESHNDAAVAIAEHVGGSVEGFAKLMNKKAEEIGCTNSHFVTPNGLDAEDEDGFHGTTAEDLARILSYCITKSEKKDAFLEITRTSTYSFTDISGKRSFTCNNHNAFLNMMEGALSGKTGFTGDAGYCYVGAVKQDDRTFTVALLGCGWPNNKGYKWSDMKTLMEYAFANYHYEDIAKDDVTLTPISVNNAANEFFLLLPEIELPVTMEKKEIRVLKADWEKVEVLYDYPKKLQAPVENGAEVGQAEYYLEGECVDEIPITAADTVKKRDFLWFGTYVWKKYAL